MFPLRHNFRDKNMAVVKNIAKYYYFVPILYKRRTIQMCYTNVTLRSALQAQHMIDLRRSRIDERDHFFERKLDSVLPQG